MDCLPVRERLTEYALSNMDPQERAFVERHLEWCAGCRKEAAELTSAAALAGEAVPQADPPADLEDRVVHAVRAVAGRAPRPARGRRIRRVVAVGVAAALVAVVAFGWGGTLAREQSASQRLHEAQLQSRLLGERLARLISQFVPDKNQQVGPRDHLLESQLAPTAGHQGGGSAAVFISPQQNDWALIVVGGLSQKTAPYRVTLRNQYGQFAYVGSISKLDAGGGASVWHEYQQHLNGYSDVIVKDRTGRIVLAGSIAPTPVATATP
ncbi:MAG: zf-HC2 domain-containing protein [Actinomycetota bacterium]|nr:zf-HC2 domain-containing protein [Actinomycetota bacterium]